MTLNKRYLRSIKNSRSFYVSSVILTITSLLLFFMCNIGGNSIIDFYSDFSEKTRVEDANFTTYSPVSQEDINDLENKYGIELEAQHFINIDTHGTTARVLRKNRKIDLYDVTVGNDVSGDDEVVISEGYAVNNKVSLGDKVKIGQKEYKVSGFFQRPDYLYMLENENDSYKNISTFFLACMTDDEFDSIGNSNIIYLVRYNGNDDTAFRKEVNEKYFMRSYLASKENMRIRMVDEQAEIFLTMSYIILIVLPLVAVALICIIISRKVKSEQKMIGTLTALGYTKGRLMRHYVGFAALPGILGGVFTVILTIIFAQPFGEICLADYEPMRIKCRLDPLAAAAGIVIPTVMYVVTSMFSVNKLLKKDTVLLLSANTDGKKKLKGVLAGRKISFKIKYAVRSLIGNPARTFVVFLGIFLGSFIVLLGFSFVDAMNYTMKNGIDDLGSYDYQYFLNELSDTNEYGGEPMLMAQLEEEDGKFMYIAGANPDSKYLNLEDVNGGRADIDGKFCITSIAAMRSGINSGDTITLYSPLTLESYDIKISGIIKNDMQCAVYTDIDSAAGILGTPEGVCNIIVSGEKLDIPEEKLLQTVNKSDSGDSIQTMIDQMGAMIYLVIILGIIICVASIYVSVNMLVTENRANISMLKVLGYTDKRIDSIVLRINHILLPIGIIASVPAVYASCNVFFIWMADYLGMLMKSDISVQSYIIAIAVTSACYFGSLFAVRHKVRRVDMVESLKDNRE